MMTYPQDIDKLRLASMIGNSRPAIAANKRLTFSWKSLDRPDQAGQITGQNAQACHQKETAFATSCNNPRARMQP